MALLPKVKLKVVPHFPSNIIGGVGIETTKQNGAVVVDMDWSEFGTQSSLPTSSTNNVLTFDPATGAYIMVPSHLLGGAVSGIAEAPIDGFQYGRTSAAWTRVPTAADAAALITLAGISPVENIWYPACDITGATDSAPIIQAAVTAAEAAGGGVIILPATGAGYILVNTSVNISKGGIHIRGFGSEEFKGYQNQYILHRGTTGTYIHTTVPISPFVVKATANGCKISDMAFTQAQPVSAPGWTPIGYPACIDHSVRDQPAFSSTGSLEVYNIIFAGVFQGIQSGWSTGTVSQSTFTGRDYFHDIKASITGTCIAIHASSDICRIENLHIWPGFFPDQTTGDIINYALANATGIGMLRNDNGMMNNIFCYGLKYGIRINGGNPDGIPQGCQINNLDCDNTHIGIFIDNVPSGSGQIVLTINNYSHAGINPNVTGDFAIWFFSNTTGVSINISNFNWIQYAGPAAYVQGTNNELVLSSGHVFTYSKYPAANSWMVTVDPGNKAWLYGRIWTADTGSSPGLGNTPQVTDNSDGPASSWISYTPTVAVSGGAVANANGRYKVINHVTTISVVVNITTGGTLNSFTLPNTAVASILAGRENATTGRGWTAVASGTNAAPSKSDDNSNAVTAGWSIRFSGSYENT